MSDSLFLSIIFGLICLDQRYIFQFNISQPLFTSTLIGLITGHTQEAVYFGALVQLLWLSNLPIGASVIPDGNIASVIGTILYIKYNAIFAEHGYFLLLISIFLVVLFSYVGGQLDIFARYRNEHIMNRALKSLRRENKKVRLGPYILASLTGHFIINVILIFTGIESGAWLLDILYLKVPSVLNIHWRFVEIALIGTGIGMILGIYHSKKNYTLIGVAAVLILIIRMAA